MRISWKYVLAGVLLVLLGPVALKQLLPSDSRAFTGVSLEDTNYREVEFRNGAQDLDLAGMLFVPEGEGPFPAAVIIHGSGTSRRDNGWYLTLTKVLQDNGVVVLRPDKRGSEKSGGDWRTASFEDLATDTLAAIGYLDTQRHVEVTNVGIVGMSQGGWIAPIVASQFNKVEFVVSFVGAAVRSDEQLAYEENYNLRQMGFLPGVSNLVAMASTRFIKHFGQRQYWQAVGNFDPLPYWREVGVSTLVLLGSDDTNVPSRESADRLYALKNSNIRVRIYEGSGHPLEDPPEYGNNIIRYDALEDISEFIDAAGLDAASP